MTPGFSARRRAERFHEAIDGDAYATSSPAPDVLSDATWLELVEQLRSVPPVTARTEFVSALRTRLMVAADTALLPAAASARSGSADPRLERLSLAPVRSRRERRLAAAVGGFALVGASASMAIASQGALPGDSLYPLKRAIEDVRTSVPMDPDARGSALLDHAAGRLDEAESLSRRGEDEGPAITEALRGFVDQASEASELLITSYETSGQEAQVREVRQFAAESMDVLADLEAAVPDDARPALVEAAQVVWGIDTAARRICPGCGGPQVDLVPALALDPASADLGRRLDTLTGATPDPGAGADGRGPRSDRGGSADAPGGGGGAGDGGSAPDGGGPTPDPTPGPGSGEGPSGTDLPADAPGLDDLVGEVGGLLGGEAGGNAGGDAKDGAGKDGAGNGAGPGSGSAKDGQGKGGAKGGGTDTGGGVVDDAVDGLDETVDDLTGDLLP